MADVRYAWREKQFMVLQFREWFSSFFCDHMSMAFCGVSKYGVLLQVLVDTRLFGIVHVDLVYSIVV